MTDLTPEPLGEWFRRIGTGLSDADYEEGIRLLAASEAAREEAERVATDEFQSALAAEAQVAALRDGITQYVADLLAVAGADRDAESKALRAVASQLRALLARADAPKPDDEKGAGWVDRHGDVWRLGDDGLMHTPETAPFPREHVEKKWGPLRPVEPVIRYGLIGSNDTDHDDRGNPL